MRARGLQSVIAALALSVSLVACKSTASSGGVAGGGGGNTNPDYGNVAYKDLDSAAAYSSAAKANHGNSAGEGVGAHRERAGACTLYFGLTYDGSDNYFPSADKYGIGGHTQWDCGNSGGAGIDRWDIHTYLRWSHTANGPWTIEDTATANLHVIDAGRGGVRFPYTTECTTDYWQLVASFNGTMTDGTAVSGTIYSQWRKITDADCARE